MSDIPQGFAISTPINNAIAAATAIGFGPAAAGAVTQATSKSTPVTLNTRTGVVTMHNAELGGEGAGAVAFTLNNNKIHATDVVIAHQGAGGTAGAYMVQCLSVANGSAVIQVANVSGGALAEAVTVNFVVIDTVAA